VRNSDIICQVLNFVEIVPKVKCMPDAGLSPRLLHELNYLAVIVPSECPELDEERRYDCLLPRTMGSSLFKVSLMPSLPASVHRTSMPYSSGGIMLLEIRSGRELDCYCRVYMFEHGLHSRQYNLWFPYRKWML
jgi:hypothetical protein